MDRNELISRSALREEISSACYNCASRDEDEYNCKYHCPIYDFLKHIDNAPTIDIPNYGGQVVPDTLQGWRYEERPHGKWRDGYGGEYLCTNCFAHSESLTPFCRHCGAEMEIKSVRPDTFGCFNCKHSSKLLREEPCCVCNEQLSEWEAKKDDA